MRSKVLICADSAHAEVPIPDTWRNERYCPGSTDRLGVEMLRPDRTVDSQSDCSPVRFAAVTSVFEHDSVSGVAGAHVVDCVVDLVECEPLGCGLDAVSTGEREHSGDIGWFSGG